MATLFHPLLLSTQNHEGRFSFTVAKCIRTSAGSSELNSNKIAYQQFLPVETAKSGTIWVDITLVWTRSFENSVAANEIRTKVFQSCSQFSGDYRILTEFGQG